MLKCVDFGGAKLDCQNDGGQNVKMGKMGRIEKQKVER